jgi:hypothetical protein
MRSQSKTVGNCTGTATVVSMTSLSQTGIPIVGRGYVNCTKLHTVITIQVVLKVNTVVWTKTGILKYSNALATGAHSTGQFPLQACQSFQTVTNFTVDGAAWYVTSGSPKQICANQLVTGGVLYWQLITPPG